MRRTHVAIAIATFMGIAVSSPSALAGDWHRRPYWHGPGWLGGPGYTFRRDPIVGVYGASAYDYDPYASYRNDNGCYRMLPVETPVGVRLHRVFVCDY